MRPQAHCAASLVIWSCSSRAAAWEAPLLVLCGNLPDFDRNVARALGVTRRDHHRWVSHSPIGWAGPTWLALRLGGGRGAVRRGVAALWVHLLLDTYADGIAWLWPLHRDKIGLFQRDPAVRDRGWQTPAALHSPLGRAELAMWGAAAGGLLRRSG